jgi:hypothetical protein
MLKKLLFQTLPFLIILLLCVPVILPYFNSGYFPTHDGEWAVVRLGDMFRTLRDMQFPPRYSGALNFGYGYPLFNFAYPMPYYIGVIFNLFLHSFILSIKLLFILSVLLSSVFMYLASSKLWSNKWSGIVSSILYIYLPYRMVDLYVRGSVGESIAMILFPFILLFALRLFESPFSRITVLMLSVSIGALVMTHNIMTILFLPVLVLFIGIRIFIEKRFDVLQTFLLCLFFGAGLSFFFWFPALYEKSNILLSKIPIADRNLYFVPFDKLIIPSWDYGTPTEKGAFTYQLGLGQIGVIIVSFFILLFSFIKSKFIQTPIKKFAIIILFSYVICLLGTFSISSLIWTNTPLLSEINYPWTLLSQLGFLSSLLAGFLVIEGREIKIIVFIMAIVAVAQVYPYARPVKYSYYSDQYYLTNEATTTSSQELMPLWVTDRPTKHFTDKVEVLSGNATISNTVYNSNSVKFKFTATSDTVFKINTIFYPGWRAYINGVETKIDYQNPQGVMTISAGKYADSVELFFIETFPRAIANGVSILTFLVLLFVLLRPLLKFR